LNFRKSATFSGCSPLFSGGKFIVRGKLRHLSRTDPRFLFAALSLVFARRRVGRDHREAVGGDLPAVGSMQPMCTGRSVPATRRSMLGPSSRGRCSSPHCWSAASTTRNGDGPGPVEPPATRPDSRAAGMPRPTIRIRKPADERQRQPPAPVEHQGQGAERAYPAGGKLGGSQLCCQARPFQWRMTYW
jgi:hypothetical protein